MSMIKYLPWIGWGLLMVMTSLYLGKRDELAESIELCNSQKLESIAQAEKIAREALQEAHSRRLSELEGLVLAESRARRIAEQARLAAESGATDAQNTIRRLTLEARNAETRTIEQECLLVEVPSELLQDLR